MHTTETPSPPASRLRRWSWVGVLALALAWSALLTGAYVIHGKHSYYREHDVAQHNGAYFVGLPEYAGRGLTGFWSPQAGTGADGRSVLRGIQPLYEGIFRLAPFWWTAGAVLFIETLCAFMGTVLLLHRRLGVSFAPAVVAACAFTLVYDGVGAQSGFFLISGVGLAGFPLLLLALSATGDSRRMAVALAGAAIGAILGTMTTPVQAFSAIPIAGFWLLLVEPRVTARHWWALGWCALACVVVNIPAIAALTANAPDSHRTLWPPVSFDRAEETLKWNTRIEEMRLLIVAHAAPIATGLVAVCLGGFRRRGLVALVCLSAAMMLQVLLMVPIRGLLQVVAPQFSTLQIDRIIVFLPFIAAAAAALGLDHALRWFGARRRRWARGLGTGLAYAGVVALLTLTTYRAVQVYHEREAHRRYGTNYAAMLNQPELRALAAQVQREPLSRVVTFAEANEQFAGQHAGFALAHGLESADGYLTLYSRRYHTFWRWVVRPATELQPALGEYFDEWGHRVYVFNPFAPIPNPVPAAHAVNLDLLSLANVRYIVTAVALADRRLVPWSGNRGTPTHEVQWLEAPSGARAKRLFVYENTTWLPRFFVAPAHLTFGSTNDLLGAMERATAADLRQTAFIEGSDLPAGVVLPPASSEPAGEVRVRGYTADRIDLDVEGAPRGILVVANAYQRFWRASVDGQAAPVLPVDLTFQGVPLPAGAKRVVLTYEPPYAIPLWRWLLMLGLAASGGAALEILWRRRRSQAGRAEARWRWRSVVPVALLVVVAGSVAVLLLRRAPDEIAWAAPEFGYREVLRVMSPRRMTTPIDLPVLIEHGPDESEFWNRVATGGDGVWFTTRGGQPLPFEVEQMDRVNRRFVAWVRVPALGWGARDVVMYSGGPVKDGRPAAVWQGLYTAVWHMNLRGGVAPDSTGTNPAQATPELATRGDTDGRIGRGITLDGVKDWVEAADSESWSFGRADWSLEFWVRPAPLQKRNFGLFQHGPASLFQLYLHNGNMFVQERSRPGDVRDHSFAGVGLEPGTWQHVAVERIGVHLKLSINGKRQAGAAAADIFEEADPSDPVTIGRGIHGALEGTIDEFRVSKGTRPPGWGGAVYAAQTGILIRPLARQTRGNRP